MTHRNLITDPATILRFIMAGKAKFTVVSQKTGTRFTYKASAPKDGGKMRFVSVLNGPDNWENYQYIGFIPVNDTNGLVAGNKGRGTAPSFVALNWVLRKVTHAIANDVVEIAGLEFWHEGHCAACGRLLTVPGSIALGFGPHCAAKYGIEPASEDGVQTALGVMDGQAILDAFEETSIPYDEHQDGIYDDHDIDPDERLRSWIKEQVGE